eukprot:3080012-Prymnesium_polylepis.1
METCTCPSNAQSSDAIILTPPETAEKHVSFQGAELRADYFCVRHANRVGATKMWPGPAAE